MARKVIQLALSPETETNFKTMYVLYDDGKIYQMTFNPGKADEICWTRLPDPDEDLDTIHELPV